MRRLAVSLVLFLLLFVAAYARLLTLSAVFPGDGVLPYDTDPYYRLREIQLIAHHFPHTPPADTYALGVELSHDPTLDRSEPWLHPSMFLFAWTLARFDRSDDALRNAAMFVPIVWALITMLLAFAVARRLSDTFGGYIAAIFAAFCMPLLWRTSLGALDNHMTEGAVFLVTLLISALLEDSPREGIRRIVKPGVLGMLFGTCTLISYWTTLAAALLTAAYTLALFALARGPERTGRILAQTSAIATMLLIAGAMNLLFRNQLPGLLLAAAGVYLLAQAYAWRKFPKFHAVIWLVLLLAGAAAIRLFTPGAIDSVITTLRVVLHLSAKPGLTEIFYSTIGETVPDQLSQLHNRFSLLIWITPLFVVLLLWRACKQNDPTRLAVCVMFAALIIPSILNVRFSHMATAAMAPLVGWGLSGIAALCTRPFAKLRLKPVLDYALKVLFLLVMLIGFMPFVHANVKFRREHPGIIPSLQETFRWIRGHTPPCEGYWNPVAQPPYRIMAAWDYGWPMLDQTQRVPVSNNAGEGVLEELNFFFRATPDEALKILQKQNARYVLATATQGKATTAFRMLGVLPDEVCKKPEAPENDKLITQAYLKTLHAGLYVADGSARLDQDQPIPALQHYRLLFEPHELTQTPLGQRTANKFFEVVQGARVEGQTTPNTKVTATLQLESNAGRHITYTDQTTANAEGKFTFTLPYPTNTPSGETRPLSKWNLAADHAATQCDIPEDAVTQGKTINVTIP